MYIYVNNYTITPDLPNFKDNNTARADVILFFKISNSL